METPFSRTERLFGRSGMERLAAARVAVFGLGGVGGYAVEALARSGVGALDLFDHDKICLTNLNRQILATRETLGEYKADIAAARVRAINPEARVSGRRLLFSPETAEQVDFSVYDYVVDAVDMVTAKIELVLRSRAARVRIISAMGAGNKIDACAFEVADIYSTSVCPLARVMRRELRARHVESLKVVYSKEPPRVWAEEPAVRGDPAAAAREAPGSNAFVPPVAGLILAGEVIREIADSGEGSARSADCD